uniref:Gonadotropin subunit beta-2 n=1 Tax=Amphiprion ocellaris TaxID=80972 RepID=A0A3Q1BTT2_AMPOC
MIVSRLHLMFSFSRATVSLPVSVHLDFQHAFILCACTLKNHTIQIERENCTQCVAVNTTICSGYCFTKDTNLKGQFGRTFLIQRSCVPLSLVYRVAHIPGCHPDVNSQLYYPVARCCSCRRCDTRFLQELAHPIPQRKPFHWPGQV